MSSSIVKRFAGHCLFQICQAAPRTRPWLADWGMRTKKDWFGDRVVSVRTPEGRVLRLASFGRNHLSFELFWKGTGYYEPITTLVARELLEPGDQFFDVGANIGFYSLVLAKARPGIEVVAFEPNPRNFAMLQSNVQASGLANVRCEPLALSDTDGTATLFLSESDMSASLRSDFEDHRTGTTTVTTRTFDSYFGDRTPRRRILMKVDVEGHEAAFFRGARRTIGRCQPDIITEVTLNYDPDTLGFFRDAGYRFYQITDQGLNEAKDIGPVVRGRFVFLNYLLSARPREEVAAVFAAIVPRVRRIDLTRTSKYLSAEAVERFTRRSSATTATAAADADKFVAASSQP